MRRRFHVLLVLEGKGTFGEQAYQQGQAWLVPAGSGEFGVTPSATTRVLRTYVP